MAGATEIVEMFDIEARRAGRWTGLHCWNAISPLRHRAGIFFGALERCTHAKRSIRSDIVLPT